MPDATQSLFSHAQASPEIVEAIERAWDGVVVRKLGLSMDNRSPKGIGGEEFAGRLTVDFTFSGEASVLIKHGLIDADILASLPPCGICYRVGFQVTRGKRLVRVNCYIVDPPEEDRPLPNENATRIWNRLAAALAPAIWRPELV